MTCRHDRQGGLPAGGVRRKTESGMWGNAPAGTVSAVWEASHCLNPRRQTWFYTTAAGRSSDSLLSRFAASPSRCHFHLTAVALRHGYGGERGPCHLRRLITRGHSPKHTAAGLSGILTLFPFQSVPRRLPSYRGEPAHQRKQITCCRLRKVTSLYPNYQHSLSLFSR